MENLIYNSELISWIFNGEKIEIKLNNGDFYLILVNVYIRGEKFCVLLRK